MSLSQRNGPHIPQAILDYFHAHYRNTTYRTFGDALAEEFPHGQDEPTYSDLMNLLLYVIKTGVKSGIGDQVVLRHPQALRAVKRS